MSHSRSVSRALLLLAFGLIQTLALTSQCIAQEHADGHDDGHRMLGLYASPSSAASVGDLIEPITLRSAGGRLNVDLIVRYETHTIGAQTVKLRSYVERNSQSTGLFGPTLRIRPSDRLVVTIHNELPPNMAHGMHDHNDPHDFNSTNLHTHGLHVSPYDDDIFRRIDPAFPGRYSYDLNNHISGTHWYHPHLHGATAMQVASGMSGALIVEGDFDHVPEMTGIRERVLIFNQIMFKPGVNGAPGELERFEDLYQKSPPEGMTINGQVKPVIKMRPGEVQRWRFIDSAFKDGVGLKLDGHEFHQIATDGIPFEQIRRTPKIGMGPGNRVDVLVKAQADPGDYYLRPVTYDYNLEYEFQNPNPAPLPKDPKEKEEDYFAIIRVEGTPASNRLPSTIKGARRPPTILPSDIKNVGNPRLIKFTIGFVTPPDPMAPAWVNTIYGINGNRFDASRIDHRLTVGSSEEWHVSQGRHPFHIHTNPFLVTEINGRLLREPMWKDVVVVPPGTASLVKLRMRYDDFDGDAVLHCHILEHEDVGMMQRIRFE